MRFLIRLIKIVVALGLLVVVGGAAYYAVTRVPALRNALPFAPDPPDTGVVVPDPPTPFSLPTELAALPTAVPPAIVPTPALSPTDAACVEAASILAGGDTARQQARGQGPAPEAGRNPGRGRRAEVRVPPGRVRNRVIIEFTETSSQRERAEYIRLIGGRGRRTIEQLDTVVVELARDAEPAALPVSPIVVSIQPDYYVGVQAAQTTNDPLMPEQWALPVIGAPAVWPAVPENSPPVTVAVIDSGVCLGHPDLQGRLTAGYDFVEDDATPQDAFGHGCGVAGIIAANTGNAVGIAGVAPNARIMPLRVLDASGLGSFSDVAAAIVFAADSGANIINLSLAGPSGASVVEEAIAYATARGVTIIGAAGNNGTEGVWYPAAYPAVVAVGSVDQSLQRSDFSNFGEIDLLAPGRDITTTSIDGSYTTYSGTSFAAPQVAGLAALARAFNTSLVLDGGVAFITPPESVASC